MRPCWRIDGNLEQNAFKVTHRSPTKVVRREQSEATGQQTKLWNAEHNTLAEYSSNRK